MRVCFDVNDICETPPTREGLERVHADDRIMSGILNGSMMTDAAIDEVASKYMLDGKCVCILSKARVRIIAILRQHTHRRQCMLLCEVKYFPHAQFYLFTFGRTADDELVIVPHEARRSCGV